MKKCEKCGGWFIARKVRMVGIKYCSDRCARNKAQQAYRIRKTKGTK